MGWTFSYNTAFDRKALIAERIAERKSASGNTRWVTIDHSARGNVLWMVKEIITADEYGTTTKRFIECDLLKSGGRDMGWGYKDMDESMGPAEVNCPLRFLDMVPCPGGFATEWRERVKAFHATNRAAPKTGARVKFASSVRYRYCGDPYENDTFTITAIPRRGRSLTCFKADDGSLVRIPGWKSRQFSLLKEAQ